jgi:hypothetical protein
MAAARPERLRRDVPAADRPTAAVPPGLAQRGLICVHPRRGGYPDVEILDVPTE